MADVKPFPAVTREELLHVIQDKHATLECLRVIEHELREGVYQLDELQQRALAARAKAVISMYDK